MKTLFGFLKVIGSLLLGLVLACAYCLVFTPIYIFSMLVIGVEFEEVMDKWIRIFTSFIEITTEGA